MRKVHPREPSNRLRNARRAAAIASRGAMVRSGLVSRAATLLLLSICACNAIVGFGELERVPAQGEEVRPDDDDDDDSGTPSPKADAGKKGPPPCDLTKKFGEPVSLGSVNSPTSYDVSPTLTSDELVIMWGRGVGETDESILTASRKSFDEPFGTPAPVSFSSNSSHTPTMTSDGLAVFWSEQVIAGNDITKAEIFVARRRTIGSPFENAQLYREGDFVALRLLPHVTRDATELYFSLPENKDGRMHIHRSLRGGLDVNQAYLENQRVDELASVGHDDGSIATSKDKLTIYFSSGREGSLGHADIFVATRKDLGSKFENIQPVAELNTPLEERPGWLSDDGCRLYMHSEKSGAGDLFVATKPP